MRDELPGARSLLAANRVLGGTLTRGCFLSQNAQQQAQANNQAFDWQTCQKQCIDN